MSQSLLYETIRNHSLVQPAKLSLISANQSWTYAELIQYANQLASELYQRVNASGQLLRLVSVCEQAEHNVFLALALAKLNATLIPLNYQSPQRKIVETLAVVNGDAVITDLSSVCEMLHGEANCLNIADLMVLNTIDNHLVDILSRPDTNSFLISMSSGSTGNPKPIVMSQQAKLARAYQSIRLYKLTSSDVVLNASPFFHSLGQRLTFVPLVAGATLALLKQFTPNAWVNAVKNYAVSFTIPVASHLYALQPILHDRLSELRSLRCIVTSSAPIDVNFKKQMQVEIGCEFHEIYGASEVASATNLAPEDFSNKFTTVGKPIDGVTIKIFDEHRQALGVGVIGEIGVSSDLRFSEYYGLPELTAQSFEGDFFLTGDLGFIDDDGFLTYVSRSKDVIISGGINIYPAEVEKCLLASKLITEVCVIGVTDKLFGEVVLAVCVGSSDVEMKLRKVANLELLSYQRPIAYFFVDVLPLTASGKVDKMTLRSTYNALDNDWTAALRMMFYK